MARSLGVMSPCRPLAPSRSNAVGLGGGGGYAIDRILSFDNMLSLTSGPSLMIHQIRAISNAAAALALIVTVAVGTDLLGSMHRWLDHAGHRCTPAPQHSHEHDHTPPSPADGGNQAPHDCLTCRLIASLHVDSVSGPPAVVPGGGFCTALRHEVLTAPSASFARHLSRGPPLA